MLHIKRTKFVNDRRGSVAIVFAYLIVPIVAFVGAAVDYATAFSTWSRLQTVTDIAATAGARLPATANSNREEAARKAFTANASGTFAAGITPTIQANNSEVTVTAETVVDTAFLGIIGVSQITVQTVASARSQIENGGVACLLALNENAVEGLHMQGINQFQSDNCWAWINSNSSESITSVGAASATAQGFCSQGKVIGAENFSPHPYTECDPIADPFKNAFLAPSSASCDFNNRKLTPGLHTLQPGVYCGGLELKPQAVATMMPGVYVIKNGQLNVQAQSVLMGNDVVFYFTGTDTGVDIRKRPTIDLGLAASDFA